MLFDDNFYFWKNLNLFLSLLSLPLAYIFSPLFLPIAVGLYRFTTLLSCSAFPLLTIWLILPIIFWNFLSKSFSRTWRSVFGPRIRKFLCFLSQKFSRTFRNSQIFKNSQFCLNFPICLIFYSSRNVVLSASQRPVASGVVQGRTEWATAQSQSRQAGVGKGQR